MNRGAPFLIGAAACAVAACASGTGAVQVRPLSGTAAAAVDEDQRLAEANAQLALGNTGLALELYRKHLRHEPESVAAQLGIAACYDRMGRYDVSRRHYEAALARSPANPDLLERFAASLDRQGQTAEAAAVRDEIRMRAEIVTATAIPQPALGTGDGQLAVAESELPLMAASVTVSLPPAEEVAAAPAAVEPLSAVRTVASIDRSTEAAPVQAPAPDLAPAPAPAERVRLAVDRIPEAVAAKAPAAPAEAAAPARPAAPKTRLVRLSPSEVALVSPGRSVWRPQVISQTASSTTVRFVPLKSAGRVAPNVRLLNAARTAGLAARTRGYLFDRGWRRIAIGDAPEIREHSLILYPASRRKTAASLAAQFGIPIARQTQGNEIVLLLGRDASGLKVLRERA